MAWRTAKDYIKRFNNIWGLPYENVDKIVSQPTNEFLSVRATNTTGGYSDYYGAYLGGKLGVLKNQDNWSYIGYMRTRTYATGSETITPEVKPLKKVYLNCRRLKNVLNTSNILTGYAYGENNFDVLSQTGIQYSKQDFINEFGEYLIVVNKDGNMMDVNYDFPTNPNLNKQSHGFSIAQVNRDLSFNIYDDFGYTVKYGDYIYPFLNFNSHTNKYQRNYQLSMANPIEMIYSSLNTNISNNIVVGWDDNENNWEISKLTDLIYTSDLDIKQQFLVSNYSLYFEKDRTLNERLFSFASKYTGEPEFPSPDVNQILIYNKRDLEEYFRAFGVEVEYIWDDLEPFDDWDEQFVVRKVRRDALANKSLNLNVEKVRREALANKEKVLSVNKVRRK